MNPFPFWWCNPYMVEHLQALMGYYGISERTRLTSEVKSQGVMEFTIKRLTPVPGIQKKHREGEPEFFHRIAGLQTAVHYGNTDGAKLMVQVIRLHYLADEILFRELMYLCKKEGEFSSNRDRLEEEVWNRLANCPDRVRLLQKADRLQKRALSSVP